MIYKGKLSIKCTLLCACVITDPLLAKKTQTANFGWIDVPCDRQFLFHQNFEIEENEPNNWGPGGFGTGRVLEEDCVIAGLKDVR